MTPYMNPVNDFYFRNSQQVFQQQPYQQQFNFPPQQPALPPINSKFVTNVEEAKASMVDGIAYNLFLDSSCGKIYLKKLGNNGTSDFLTYTLEQQKKEEKSDPLNEINMRLERIENFIGGLNVQSISSSTGNGQPEPVYQSAVAEPNEPNGSTESAGISENARNDKWQKRR